MTRTLPLVVSLLAATAVHVSAGWYFTANPFSYAVGTNVSSVAVADVNSDGWPDMIAAHSPDPNLHVLTNKGDGTFASASIIRFAFCSKVIAADMNGDNLPDLIALQAIGGSFAVLTNTGGTFAFASTNLGNGGVDAKGFLVVDLDADGWKEVITMSGGPLQIFTNDHRGAFMPSTSAYSDGFYPWAAAPGDFNNDSSIDLLVSHYEDLPRFMTNNGLGTLVPGPSIQGFGGPYTPWAADMNHDGLIDCVLGESLLTNDASGHFILANANIAGAGDQLAGVADLDRDLWPEAVAQGSVNTINVRTNDHGNVFSTAAKRVVGRFEAAADVNGDGWPDLILSATNTIQVLFHYEWVPLSIQRAGSDQITISWPFTEPLAFVESAPKCAPPPPLTWTMLSPVTNEPLGRLEFTTPTSQPMEFFRQRQ